MGAGTEPTALEVALEVDRLAVRERMRSLLGRTEIREALFVASISLERDLHIWMRAPESDHGQSIEHALIRYIGRMASRSTPFGLFAGCSLGRLSDRTDLALASPETYRRCSRLDGDYLERLAAALSRTPEVKRVLSYLPNSSLYRVGGWWRYTEARAQNKLRSYHLVDVRPTSYLDTTLELASSHVQYGSLAGMLVERQPSLTLREAESYLDSLIDAQILQPSPSPVVTSVNPLRRYFDELHQLLAPPALVQPLEQTLAAIVAIDQSGIGVAPERYRAVTQTLELFPAQVDPTRLFQVDLFKPGTATLGTEVLAEIRRGIHLLSRICETRPREDLRRFKEGFQARYESRAVPLVMALDEDIGIGFGVSGEAAMDASPLLVGLDFPARPAEASPWGPRQSHLLRRIDSVLSSGARELVLDDEDLKVLESAERLPLPDAFAVMATLAAPAGVGDPDGFRLLLSRVTGPSGANLLGRFCHLEGAIEEAVKQHLRAEEALRPDAIYAEVAHLPEGRIGNILTRPLFREYEIPFLGVSGAPADRQIPITDLVVAVRSGRIVLYSQRLQREIVPRLTAAHNFGTDRNLGIYRFLCALQSQGVASDLRWSWGPLASAAHLPRVVSGRLILALECWNVAAESWKAILNAKGADRFLRMQALRVELQLPRMVSLRDGDNVLVVDLDNVLSIESLLSLVKTRETITLLEHFPNDQALCAYGPDGRFAHELVIPFVRPASIPASRPPPRCSMADPATQRSFSPGSEWLYAKLYTGTATADRILREEVAPLVQELDRGGTIDRWFFIRYRDPDWHLRLRFHGHKAQLNEQVLPKLQALAARLEHTGLVWQYQLDTYHREIERYGGDEGILLAEEIFHIDSEAVSAILQRLSGEAGAITRWQLALRGIDMMLTDFGIDIPGRLTIADRVTKALGEEHRVSVSLQQQLGTKYREYSHDLDRLFRIDGSGSDPLDAGVVFLLRRSRHLRLATARLRALEAVGRLSVSIPVLAESYIHMFVNRILRSAMRTQEFVLYYFLGRIYRSQLARQK